MIKRLFALTVLIALAGCQTSPSNHYYTLSAVEDTALQNDNISLRKVTIPGTLDRSQMVLITGANIVEIQEYDRWAESLDSMIKRVLAYDLGASVSSPSQGARKISVVVDEFGVEKNGYVILRATWTEQNNAHQFEEREPADYHNEDAVVAAMSYVLNDLATAIKHRS
jgi:uncharacterized lipoprotein YmbA